MKRFALVAVILVILFITPTATTTEKNRSSEQGRQDLELLDSSTLASAGGLGLTRNTTAFMTRIVNNQSLRILNSYSSTSQHTGLIDFTDFHISGWDLYGVEMDVMTITAAAERETTGITPNSDIQIQNSTLGAVTDALYQEFYNMPHDGRLENYSFAYKAPYYSTALGKAYLVVRSAYDDPETNVTSWITPFNQISSYTTMTHDCASDAAILDASMPYFVVIDGTTMIGVDIGSGIWLFNWIYWRAQDVTGTDTGYHYRNDNTWYQYVGLGRREAELQYTYTPWNKTTNAALTFFDPLQIDIKGNSSPVDGLEWVFNDDSNIVAIDFNSNQSVDISFSMELLYRKSIQSLSSWNVVGFGDAVNWNVTTELEYPALSEQRYLNVSVPTSWTATGLYNTSTPSYNHGDYESLNGTIRCSNMANDTWTLTSSSHNFLQSIRTFNQLDNTEITTKTNMTVNIDINSTLSDLDLDPVATGFTNLTIWHLGTRIWAPSNASVVNGKTHYLWNISETSTFNGLYTIEEHWSNGTEAGYRSKSLTLYYPTSFNALNYQINAFTESAFSISVYLEDTFTPQGLDGDVATVAYSFASGSNTSLFDHNNGTWTASVSTAERTNGTFSIIVYAEGYAIQNQSLTIFVTLIHDTEPLTVEWSATNNISYVQATDLLVEYRRAGGTAITDATVNVTIDGNVLSLTWDGDLSLYRITVNGTDTFSGFDTYDLVIRAWKAGYKAQSNDTEDITIHEEYTELSVNWSHGTNITFVECSILSVEYRMSNSTAIPLATVDVTDGISTWHLQWNGTSRTYWIQFNGTDTNPGFGTHLLMILASRLGYESQEDASYSLTLREEPTSLTLTWSDGTTITYIQSTVLIVNYTMSDGSTVVGAIVNVSIGSGFWTLHYNPGAKTYDLTLNGSDVNPGFGAHSVTVVAAKAGFGNGFDDSEVLALILEPTSLVITWSMGNNITYVQQTTLTVTYKMSDETPIMGANVNVTIDGNAWTLAWDGSSSYVIMYNGSDIPPGFGRHDLSMRAGRYGFVNRIDVTQDLILRQEPTSIDTVWVGLSTITYVGSTLLSVNYTMSNGAPVAGAFVQVTIDSMTWNLTWDEGTGTYRLEFSGSDNPPGLGSHVLIINASRFGFITAYGSKTLVIVNEPTTLTVEWIPTNNITYTNSCILSIRYLMNSNNSAITGATVIATFAGAPWALLWNSTAQRYYLLIDGDVDLPILGAFPVTVEASRYGFDSASNSSQEIVLRREPTYLSVHWANEINNPDFFSYSYLIVEYTYGSYVPVLDAEVNVTIDDDTWKLTWNQTEGYYQLRFNGSDPVPGVGTHSLTVRAWEYGFVEQTNSDEEVILPVIPTLLNLAWTNGDTITYVEKTTLQAFYRMYNDTWITDATVNVTINGVTLALVWNSVTHAYERTFTGMDGSLDFTTYPVLVVAHLADFQSQTNSAESLTKQLESTDLIILWIGGNNITYFSETRLSVQFVMSNSSLIATGVLNATINGYLWNLVWNSSSSAYETLIHGNDSRLYYSTFDVTIYASGFGYISAMDSTEELTIRLEDTYITFEWIPSSTISYLDVTVFRIYYRYLNGSPVLTATVNASYVLPYPTQYNSSSGAYEIAFTGADIPSPALGPHTFFVLAWKANHLAHSDITQTLTIVQEDTSIQARWLDGNNTITYVESASLFINFSITESGLPVIDAFVTIRIGTHTWEAVYNETSKLYVYTFTGNMDPPGLGSFVLYISATYLLHEGFKDATDNSRTLVILSESVNIQSYWIGGGIITYVHSTILVVNYTMSNGSAIASASVNITIGSNHWDLAWDEVSKTYRLMFNGSDSLPGLGYHELEIRAGRDGFDSLNDNTLSLEIVQEPTMLTPRWSNPYQNTITYFEYTYLFVEYSMSNGTPILDAPVNVTIELLTLKLYWNATEEAYGIRFNGSDIVPGFGIHGLAIVASKYGFVFAQDLSETLEVGRDPTTIQVSWSSDNDISFVEHTTLMVYYRMSNGSPVPSAIIDVSIGSDSWSLAWNASAQAYCLAFYGNMDPPGMGSFIMDIEASGSVYVDQSASTSLAIHEEPTSAIASWISETLDWTQSIVLEVEYRDNYGRLIEGAILKTITIDGVLYALKGTNGVYWFEFNNTFDLGHHLVVVNISKYGYDFATNSNISFDIIEASTSLELLWNAITIDYLGQMDLSANYSYAGTGSIVPQGGVIANITIDGSVTLSLLESGSFWVVSLTGVYLDLGPHSIVVRAQAYGYSFAESAETLTVNEVTTNTLLVTWSPFNLTIEFTDSLNVTVDYTFYDGDVPENATVNVTINSRVYNLAYSSGAWRVSIFGNQTGIGTYDASISAWLYGYALQTHITMGLNISPAANMYLVTWQPSSLAPTYVDIINVSVVYIQDYKAILGASVRLSINGTIHELTYSSFDEMWHFSIRATAIGLGAWNVTVTANKTGYVDGWYSNTLIVFPAATTLDVSVLSSSIYHDEGTIVYIYYEMSNSSFVPDATLILALGGIEQATTWDTDRWTAVFQGTELGIGIHNLTITVSALGFVSQYEAITISVLPIPTEVAYSPSHIAYAQEDIVLRFAYIDNRTGTGIPGSVYSVDWIGPYSVMDLGNGTYLVQISGSSLHVGNYTFDIALQLAGYLNGSGIVEIEARPIPTELLLISQISQYENEVIIIQAKLVDLVHYVSIDWAVITATLEGVQYFLLYDAPTQNYTMSIQLPSDISPGTYTVSISANAVDCDAKVGVVELHVLPKSTYALTLNVVGEILTGSELLISVIVQHDEQPAGYVPLTLIVVIFTQSDSRNHTQVIETDDAGVASVVLSVPLDATRLEITALYAGSISVWPAESETRTVQIKVGGLGLLDVIFRDPILLSMVVGGVSLPVLGLVIMKRRRSLSRNVIASTETSSMVSSVETISIADPIDRMKDAITVSESGLTRSELSKRLGISSSKTSAIVKDLLDSDSGFYEVREGTRRIIKKR
ncbi:MAG: hypothetical protein C4K48_05515 [Candidatus Thorarchaeota archaeon]|nr:MAG: hypothetical protein C4K48_05515 [Candidatus Thorarchaeota archaeon]